MPDISMCANSQCPSKVLCYRYTATPNPYRQSYADFQVSAGEAWCNSFTPNEQFTVLNPVKESK